MEQAKDQPAVASSASPALAAMTTTAHPMKPITATTTAQVGHPAQGFWAKTMDPTVFWTAASAVATFLAVAAAFVIPWLTDRRQQRRRQAYASGFLLPVFDEIDAIAEEAKHCKDSAMSLSNGLQMRSRGTPGLEWHNPRGLAVSDAAARRLRALATTKLVAYAANRTWISDLELESASEIHRALHDSFLLLNDLESEVQSWPTPPNITSEHLARYWERADALERFASKAATRLAPVVGVPIAQRSPR